jgi:hypothetical protein
MVMDMYAMFRIPEGAGNGGDIRWYSGGDWITNAEAAERGR